MQKDGFTRVYFKDRGFKNIILTLNISQTGRVIFVKFSGIAGLCRPSVFFRPEVCDGSNFQGIDGHTVVAKNGIALCRWVALNRSQTFCTKCIFTF